MAYFFCYMASQIFDLRTLIETPSRPKICAIIHENRKLITLNDKLTRTAKINCVVPLGSFDGSARP